MEMRRLTATLLGIAVTAIILALALPHWGCGNLIENCPRGYDRDAIIAVAALLIIGLACLLVVFIIDLVLICSSVVPAGLLTARFVLLYLGAGLILIAVIVFTAKRNALWSYFLAVIGAIFAVLVAILAIMSSRCVTGSERVVVRTTH
uniref:Neutral sphingomyelinase n=1 Tax=Schistocephalus solidus TaxID=70667 RepID=A0A0X3P9R0_SCHSO